MMKQQCVALSFVLSLLIAGLFGCGSLIPNTNSTSSPMQLGIEGNENVLSPVFNSAICRADCSAGPDFKFPLPQGEEWLITVEAITGKTFNPSQPVDSYHINKYAIDIDNCTKNDGCISNVPVLASADGEVISAGWDRCAGWFVKIEHDSAYVTKYLHMQSRPLVQVHEQVSQGTQIGVLGNTGSCSAGSHIHFEIIPPSVNIIPSIEHMYITDYKAGSYYPSSNSEPGLICALDTAGCGPKDQPQAPSGTAHFTLGHPSSERTFAGSWDGASRFILSDFKCDYFGGLTQVVLSGTDYNQYPGEQSGADCIFHAPISPDDHTIAFAPGGSDDWYYFVSTSGCSRITSGDQELELLTACR